MTTRRKTIEYAFQSVSDRLTPNTWRELSEITLYIPESSVTFKNVLLEWYFREDSGSLINDQYMAIDLGNTGWDQYNDTTNAITYSSENESFLGVIIRDCTSYFTANWSGTSMSFKVRIKTPNASNPWWAGIGAKLYITYEYDDTSSTQIKTVRIPIESRNNTLAVENTWYSVGTSQIPQLTSGGLLPEANITIRHMHIDILGKDGTNGTSPDSELLARIDTGSASYLWYLRASFNTTCPIHCFLDVTSMDPTSAHDLQVSSNSGSDTNVFNNLGGWLTVTYEFSPDSTTSVLNSVLLPIPNDMHNQDSTSSDKILAEHKFYIPEPGTITLKQSAVVFQINDEGYDHPINVGSQSPITWDSSYGTGAEDGGSITIVHRIDAGGAAGSAGVTLSNGQNSIKFQMYQPTAAIWDAGNWRAFAILNYTSSVADEGPGAHSHPVKYLISPHVNAVYGANRDYTKALDITESNYLITGAMMEYRSQTSSYDNVELEMLAEYGASEGPGDGWALLLKASDVAQNTENQMIVWAGYMDRWFKLYPEYPYTDRMDIETSRRYRFATYGPGFGTITAWVNYSSITYDISGTVYGYTGDGSGISVQIYRASDHEHLLNATTSAGGGYSATWYDGSEQLYAAARQDSSHVGRSDNGVAV